MAVSLLEEGESIATLPPGSDMQFIVIQKVSDAQSRTEIL
jgi:hypothetical protein